MTPRRALLSLPLALAAPRIARAAEAARIAVATDRPGRPVPRALFGTNLQWEHDGDGVLLPGPGTSWRPGLFEAIESAGISVLRFPGGSLANTYRWRDGTGPRDRRAGGLSYDFRPIPSRFGSDEFLALASRTKTEAIVTANLSAGPDEAADWVSYLTDPASQARARNGHPAPIAAPWWEIGNELYAPRERGHLTAAAYAAHLAPFAAAMRARNPAIQLGAMLEGAFQQAAWMHGVMPHLMAWNETVLKDGIGAIDFVALHFAAPFDTLWRDARLNELVWAGPLAFRDTIAGVRAQLARHGRPAMPIVVSEYTTFFGGAPAPRIATAENAIFAALMLMEMMRTPQVTAAANWSLINNSSFGMLRAEAGGPVQPRPLHAAFAAMASLAGKALLPVSLTRPGYTVPAKGNVPGYADVGAIDAVAVAAPGGAVELAVVNRAPGRPIDATPVFPVPLRRVAGTQWHGGEGQATAWQTARLPPAPPGAVLALPPGSLTLLRFEPIA
jgi:alpha-N-arabinofuranosidase